MVEVIFHIGMGKTGTSSIQAALDINRIDLSKNHKLDYLGMWFGLISQDFVGYVGQQRFFELPEDELKLCSEKFFNALKRQASNDDRRYILSNEAIYGYPDKFSVFCNALSEFCRVSVVCYARDPVDWLPSAYVQWGVYHKANKGGVISFEEYARRHIKSYAALLRWSSLLVEPSFTLRKYTKGRDIVADFASLLQIVFQDRPSRILERVGPAEVVLRTAYNNLFDNEVLPGEFNSAFGFPDQKLFSLKRVMGESLDYSSVDDVVREQHAVFDGIFDRFGLELRGERTDDRSEVSETEIREEIFDCLIHQAAVYAKTLKDYQQRLDALEDKVAQLTAEIRPCS